MARVAFQLERFDWAAGRLEVVGRWTGLGAHRLRPVLIARAADEVHRLPALPEAPEGDGWGAAFAWAEDPAAIIAAELDVGRNVVVDLPRPDPYRRPAPPAPPVTVEEPPSPPPARKPRLRRAKHAPLTRDDMPGAAAPTLVDGPPGAPSDADAAPTLVAGPPKAPVDRDEAPTLVDEPIPPAAAQESRLRAAGEAPAGAPPAAPALVPADHLVATQRERDAAVEAVAKARAEIDDLHQAFADAADEAEQQRDRIRALETDLERARAELTRLLTSPPEAAPVPQRLAALGARPPEAETLLTSRTPPLLLAPDGLSPITPREETAPFDAVAGDEEEPPPVRPATAAARAATGEAPAVRDEEQEPAPTLVERLKGLLPSAGSREETATPAKDRPAGAEPTEEERVAAGPRGARPVPDESVPARPRNVRPAAAEPTQEERVPVLPRGARPAGPPALPRPVRTATPARRRASHRRRPELVWAMRILAFVVAVLMLVVFAVIVSVIA